MPNDARDLIAPEFAEFDRAAEGGFILSDAVIRRPGDAPAADAPICPECGATARLVPSATVYGRSYGRDLWVCGRFPACDTYVGTHPDGRPLGTLAGPALRAARNLAHATFDPLWRDGWMRREAAYRWLSEAMGLPREDTHIALFDADQCADVVVLAKMKRLQLAEEGTGGLS